jgi:hypothetical protein
MMGKLLIGATLDSVLTGAGDEMVANDWLVDDSAEAPAPDEAV